MSNQIDQFFQTQVIYVPDLVEGIIDAIDVDGPSHLAANIVDYVIKVADEGSLDDDSPEELLKLAAASALEDLGLRLLKYSQGLRAEAQEPPSVKKPQGTRHEYILEVTQTTERQARMRLLTDSPDSLGDEVRSQMDDLDWDVFGDDLKVKVISHFLIEE